MSSADFFTQRAKRVEKATTYVKKKEKKKSLVSNIYWVSPSGIAKVNPEELYRRSIWL